MTLPPDRKCFVLVILGAMASKKQPSFSWPQLALNHQVIETTYYNYQNAPNDGA